MEIINSILKNCQIAAQFPNSNGKTFYPLKSIDMFYIWLVNRKCTFCQKHHIVMRARSVSLVVLMPFGWSFPETFLARTEIDLRLYSNISANNIPTKNRPAWPYIETSETPAICRNKGMIESNAIYSTCCMCFHQCKVLINMLPLPTENVNSQLVHGSFLRFLLLLKIF